MHACLHPTLGVLGPRTPLAIASCRPRALRCGSSFRSCALGSGSRPASCRLARRPLSARAVASTEAPPSADTTTLVFTRTFPLPSGTSLTVRTAQLEDGSQEVLLTTDQPGRVLLHWGVEGGPKYKGGWRLPGGSARPEGSFEYKKRALQTPFALSSTDGTQELRLHLPAAEASDCLNFVLRDDNVDAWYDLNGTNFQVPLRPGVPGDSGYTSGGDSMSSGEYSDGEGLLSMDQLPPLPQDLSGVWSYMKWEDAGCPNRSKEEADSEYNVAVKELTSLLRRGVSVDLLRSVADAGVRRYSEFMADMKRKRRKADKPKEAAPAAAAVAAPPAPPVHEEVSAEPAHHAGTVELVTAPQQDAIPEELVGIKAYLLWEEAGRPDGAEFSDAARAALQAEVRSGRSMADIEAFLRSPPPPAAEAQPSAQAEPAAPQWEQPAFLGESMGVRERNPLNLVHRSSPPKLAERPRERLTPLGPLVQAAGEDEACVWYRLFGLGSKSEMLIAVRQEDPSDLSSPVHVTFTTDQPSHVVLHWGVKMAGRSSDWRRPSEALLPRGSTLIADGIAAETPFKGCTDEECQVEIGGALVPLQRTSLSLPRGHELSALTFVMRSEDGTRWWNDGGANYNVPLPGPRAAAAADPCATFDDDLSRIIVDCEVHSGAWTLMHRFNKAAELINGVVSGAHAPADEAMARIFVWLRYSAIRQLTWQRNYNTQPRILGAAQERLTHAVAAAHERLDGQAREWARLCLTTVGRGGNAQAVRDEILNIMHRNKISEVKGTWMEEFHQKLHNNTTPDDVPICEAYIAFLHSGGDLGTYWRVLSDAGITRARLESFDRAIVQEPQYMANKRDSLIHDFNNYLSILKATHSGADLQASASAAAPFVPGSARSYLGYVLGHTNSSAVLPLIEAAVEARTELAPALSSNRELIYLDLALENVVRGAAERGASASGTSAAALLGPLLQNVALSTADNEELCYCLKAWNELPRHVRQGHRPAKDDALRAMAVLDRIRRALAEVADRTSALIGPVSQGFGEAFGCEPWAVQLFPEEVVRGGPAFAVSLALSAVEPAMRSAAELGAWQVISPAAATGRVVVVPDLHGIQDVVYEQPTVLLARRVTGEEEVPMGAVALLSGDCPDVLSHLSVRARNMRVLFAACHDAAALEEVAALEGKVVDIHTTAAGEVTYAEAEEATGAGANSNGTGLGALLRRKLLHLSSPAWSGKWAVGMDAFADGVVGAKSKNLAGLRGRLPEWINLPPSCTMPFGAFEEALRAGENSEAASQLAAAIAAVTPAAFGPPLSAARAAAATVQVPAAAQAALRAAMAESGVPAPAEGATWDAALRALRAVWASKYNDRAYLSTLKVGIDYEAVRMAVLCQAVVPARYAFVIHTTNPTTGDEGEVYCELVRGLGESIVSGTVPGTALAFVARKDALDDPQVLLYPSKSEGMFVEDGSLIFRSDSNGEDLEGYAGAGLYESVTTAETRRALVDYSSDPIVSDPEFRRKVMSMVCRAGAEIEAALEGPQDVEGVIDHDLKLFVVQTRPQQ